MAVHFVSLALLYAQTRSRAMSWAGHPKQRLILPLRAEACKRSCPCATDRSVRLGPWRVRVQDALPSHGMALGTCLPLAASN